MSRVWISSEERIWSSEIMKCKESVPLSVTCKTDLFGDFALNQGSRSGTFSKMSDGFLVSVCFTTKRIALALYQRGVGCVEIYLWHSLNPSSQANGLSWDCIISVQKGRICINLTPKRAKCNRGLCKNYRSPCRGFISIDDFVGKYLFASFRRQTLWNIPNRIGIGIQLKDASR